MAKRGYRGKHPFNDMKVAPTEHKAANLNKLTNEYDNTGTKNKYDYIKSHDGFFPQGDGKVTFTSGVATADLTITVISTDGTSIAYTAAEATDTTENEYINVTAAATKSAAFLACVNAAEGHGGKILATAGTAGVVILTQVEPGPDGNTTITVDGVAAGTLGAAVNFTNG